MSSGRTGKPTYGLTIHRMRMAIRRMLASARRTGRGRRHAQPHVMPAWLVQHWERLVLTMRRFGGSSLGNAVVLFTDGDRSVEAIWEAMAQARRRVWVEMYIIEPDRVGTRTIQELTQAAQRGCEVILLHDAVGSSRMTESALDPLRKSGARIEVFNSLRLWRPRWPSSFLRRDHRKIILVDDRIGFCGGMNLTEDYAGKTHGNGRFVDSLVRMEGPCVRDLAAVFSSSWRSATKQRVKLPRRRQPAGETFVQVQASRGALGRRSIQRALRLLISNAVDHCYITSSYFVPPPRLRRAILRAVKHGVDVRILTAGISDVPIVHLASQHIYGSLLRRGVRIFEMYDATLHAKTITIDGVCSTVGSFNLDTWSDQRNLEVNVAMIDLKIAQELKERFLRDIQAGQEVTLSTWHKRPWWMRAIHWTAYQLMRL